MRLVICLIIAPMLLLFACESPTKTTSKSAEPPTPGSGQYIVTYHANQADSGTVPVDPKVYVSYSVSTSQGSFKVLPNSGNLTRMGYTFAGWGLSPTQTFYTIGSYYRIDNKSVDIYAVWTPVPTSKVITFDSQGADTAASPGSRSFTSSSSWVALPDEPLRSGYAFCGWFLEPNGQGDPVYSDRYCSESDVWYAYWRPITNLQTMALRDLVVVAGNGGLPMNQEATNYTTGNFDHTLSGFRMGKYEVSYELWHLVRQWSKAKGYAIPNPGRAGKLGEQGRLPSDLSISNDFGRLPVTTMNSINAMLWCNAYSEATGLDPVYYTDTALTTVYRGGAYNIYCDWSRNGYRLPSEGEWEYAARNRGTTSASLLSGVVDTSGTGNPTDSDNEAVGWISVTEPHPIGGKAANGLGMYDMSGNVSELCWDWYADYPTVAQSDYRGALNAKYSGLRIVRGGAYNQSYAVGLRVSLSQGYANTETGLRVVRSGTAD